MCERKNFYPSFLLSWSISWRDMWCSIFSCACVYTAVKRTGKVKAGRAPLVTLADKNGISLPCVCVCSRACVHVHTCMCVCV